MPNYKGHIIGAVATYSILLCLLHSYNPTSATIIEWFLCTVAGALFPDIDTKSKGQKYFYYCIACISFILLIRKQFQTLSFVCLVALSPLFVRHRGITHSLWFIAFLCFIVIAYAHCYVKMYTLSITLDMICFFCGALSHVVLDVGIRRALRLR